MVLNASGLSVHHHQPRVVAKINRMLRDLRFWQIIAKVGELHFHRGQRYPFELGLVKCEPQLPLCGYFHTMGTDLERTLLSRSASDAKAWEQWLASDEAQRSKLAESFQREGKLPLEAMVRDRIVHEDHLKSLCVEYRLRFLDANHFAGQIPYEAVAAMERLDAAAGIRLNGYKIVAPASLFRLTYQDKDPLLLLELGGGYHYLVHKWGGEVNPLRRVVMYPLRSFKTMMQSILVFCAAVALAVPESVIGAHSGFVRGIFFFYLLFATSAMAALYGFSRAKNFSENLWTSRYDD
jgi:hypothetical protein